MAHPHACGIEQAHHLLRGPGRRDDADLAVADGVGEAEGDAADDGGGAAVGAHDQDVRGRGGVLEPDLVLDGHVVREEHHGDAAVDRIERLDGGVLSGHRDQGEVGLGGGDRAAERAPGRRLAEAAGVRARRFQLRERGVEGGPARGGPLVGAADGDHEVVGARLGRDGEAHRGDHLGVELGRHGDLGRLDAGGGGHGS